MKTKMNTVVLAAVMGVAGAAGSASAQTAFTIDWKVNGVENVSVNPGDVVTVTAVGRWISSPAVFGFGNTQVRVPLANANASDVLNFSEAGGFGRAANLRVIPSVMSDTILSGVRTIVGTAGNAIDISQNPQFINPLYSTANPINLFSFIFIAGTGGRTVNIGTTVQGAQLHANMMGIPVVALASTDGASISIVPTPGSMALLGLGGLLAARRKR